MVATITCQPLAASPSQRPIRNGWKLSPPAGPDRPAPRHGAQQAATWHLPDGLQRPSATRGLPGWRPVLGARVSAPITRGRLASSRPGSALMQTAWTTWTGYAGRVVSPARPAETRGAG